MNSNVAFCHTHRRWTIVDSQTSHFVCGELAVWDVPGHRYLSIEQAGSELPRALDDRVTCVRMLRLLRALAC